MTSGCYTDELRFPITRDDGSESSLPPSSETSPRMPSSQPPGLSPAPAPHPCPSYPLSHLQHPTSHYPHLHFPSLDTLVSIHLHLPHPHLHPSPIPTHSHLRPPPSAPSPSTPSPSPCPQSSPISITLLSVPTPSPPTSISIHFHPSGLGVDFSLLDLYLVASVHHLPTWTGVTEATLTTHTHTHTHIHRAHYAIDAQQPNKIILITMLLC